MRFTLFAAVAVVLAGVAATPVPEANAEPSIICRRELESGAFEIFKKYAPVLCFFC